MTILTNFKEYTPTDESKIKLQAEVGVIFIKCDQDVDWYESQTIFDATKLKIVFDTKTGVVYQTGVDITSLWPNGCSVADIDLDLNTTPEDLNGKVFDFHTGKIVDRKFTSVELKSRAKSKITQLQAEATALIQPLQYAKDLGMITEEESAYLTELQRYVVQLNRVTSQEGYPTEIEWPVLPIE